MDAQVLTIAMHDEPAGYEVTPDRVPLALLRTFAKDVDEFPRGDGNDVDTASLDVAVVPGSLALRTAPLADPTLLHDLKLLSQTESLDALGSKRRSVVERWQRQAKATRKGRHFRVCIAAAFLERPVLINANTDFRTDDADQWVRVERYVRGEIEDMGGHAKANAHVRLPDGKSLVVDTTREALRDEKVNRLYKPAMLRIRAEYNVMTREYRNARLLEFIEHASRVDEKDLERRISRGAIAWRDVPNAAIWVENFRGNDV